MAALSTQPLSLSLAAPPNENYQYQFAVMHYIGDDNTQERGECEEFVEELKVRIFSTFNRNVSIFSDWDSTIGHDIFDVVSEVGSESKFMVVVLSPTFIRDLLHMHKLKTIFKTLLGQKRLIPIAIGGVSIDAYPQLSFMNVIHILRFTCDWRSGSDDKWSKLLKTLCNPQSPIVTSPETSAVVYQSARSPYYVDPGLGGIIMETDGRAGINTLNNIRKDKYFQVIQDHVTIITENIEVNDFSSYLIQDRVFSIDQMQEVTCERTRLQRAKAFVCKLKEKSADQIRLAIESMGRSYSHVYTPLKQGLDRIDWEMRQEDGPGLRSMPYDDRHQPRYPVQDSSMRVDVHALPPANNPLPIMPSAPSPSVQAVHASQEGSRFDTTDHQVQSSIHPALQPRSLEIINAEIARLEAMKAQMVAMQAAQSRTSLVSQQSPAHLPQRTPVHAPQHPTTLPSVRSAVPIQQDLLPFSPTDEAVFRQQIYNPESQFSSVSQASVPRRNMQGASAVPVEGSANASFASRHSGYGGAASGGAAPSHGYPTNPNAPEQVQDRSTSITTGVRDMSIEDSQNLPSLDLSVSGGEVRQ